MKISHLLKRGSRLAYLITKYTSNPIFYLSLLIFNTSRHKYRYPFSVKFKNNLIIQFNDIYTFDLFLSILDNGFTVKELLTANTVTVCKDSICLKIRTTEGYDIGHIHEIFIDKIYGEKFSGTVIDVGAYNADSSIYFAVNGAERVIALEPYPEYYQLAKENIKLNNLENKIILLPYALSNEEGERVFYISESNPNANSLNPSPEIKKYVNFNKQISVKTISLRTIFNNFNINRVSLLKLDCEGCEYEVLRSSKDLLDKIEKIVLEYHNFPQDIPDILRSSDFKVEVKVASNHIGMIYAEKS